MDGEFSLLQDVAIIMAVAGGALFLSHRLRQPPILGYLVAGVLIGPFTFGGSWVSDLGTVRLLADLGLILLLFSIGLEFGWDRLRRLGLNLVVIAAVEITVMMALGYQLGRLLGWSGMDSLFLGAALSSTSSAIIVKVLRDTGRLQSQAGRLVVGISVVEDFGAVILLTILSGVAASGAASADDIGRLSWKVALFALVALAVSTLFAPRIMDAVARYNSRETLLVVALALCFGLALVAEELELSSAAGAFLIGAVLGDTRHAKELTRIMEPLRDMFAAIFFVSIGMLVDVDLVKDYIGPALAVTALFIVGKIVANTAAAFATGHDGETSLQAGAAMPQPGELSLAIAKVGADRAAVGPALYPVVVATTAICTVAYPWVLRLTPRLTGYLGSHMPQGLARWVFALRATGGAVRLSMRFRSSRPEVRSALKQIILNLVIVLALLAAAPSVLRFGDDIARNTLLSERVLGLVVGGGALVLCVPSAIAIWLALRTLADALAEQIIRHRMPVGGLWSKDMARVIVRNLAAAALMLLFVVWSLPLVTELLSLGGLAAPVPLALLALMTVLTAGAILRVHRALVSTVTRTLLGDGTDADGPTKPAASPPAPARSQE